MKLSIAALTLLISSVEAFAPSTFGRVGGVSSLDAKGKSKKAKKAKAEKEAPAAVEEEPVAVVKEPTPAPAPAPVDLAKKYAGMEEEERNFSILVDLGIITVHQDPDEKGYDSSKDDEFCAEYDE